MAHDNPADQHFHGSLVLGFADRAARSTFFERAAVRSLSAGLAERVSAVHAYDVSEGLTYVQNGRILPHYLA